MKVGMNMMSISSEITTSHSDQLIELKKLGYHSVEIPNFSGKSNVAAKLGLLLSELGLSVSCSTALPANEHAAGLLSDSMTTQQAAKDFLKNAIENSAELGSKLLCGPMTAAVGYFTGSPPTEREFRYAVEGHRELAEFASSAGVLLAYEPLNRFETHFVNTMADAALLADAVNHDSFGILYDTFHANIEERDPIGALNSIGEHLFHVHISENDRGVPGSGHIDFKALVNALNRRGYNGWLTIEAFGQTLPALASATRVWRSLFKDFEELSADGIAHLNSISLEGSE